MDERQRLLIYGAGGHGRVILDAAPESGAFELCGFLDDDPCEDLPKGLNLLLRVHGIGPRRTGRIGSLS